MKNKRDTSDTLHTVLICLCLLVIACVEMFTSGILKSNDTSAEPTLNAAASNTGHATAIRETVTAYPLMHCE